MSNDLMKKIESEIGRPVSSLEINYFDYMGQGGGHEDFLFYNGIEDDEGLSDELKDTYQIYLNIKGSEQ